MHATDVSNASRTLLFDIRTCSLVRADCATCSGVPMDLLPEVRPVVGTLRGHRVGRGRRRRRDPGQRHRRRPAGGPVRPGLLRAGHDQEHLRHRLVRAHERGRDLPRAGRRAADHRGLDRCPRGPRPGRTGDGHPLRPRGRHLRDRRGRAVAARRAGDHRRGRPRSDRWPSRSPTPRAWCWSRPSPGWAAPGGIPTPGARWLGITRGTGRAHLARAVVEAMAFQTRDVVDAMTAASGRQVRVAAGRRRRLGHGPAAAAPGRPAGRAGQPAAGAGDDGAGRGLPGRPGRGRLGLVRRHRRQLGARRRGRPDGRPGRGRRRPRPAGVGRGRAAIAAAGPRGLETSRRASDPSRSGRGWVDGAATGAALSSRNRVSTIRANAAAWRLSRARNGFPSRPSTSAMPAPGSGAQTTSAGPPSPRPPGPTTGCPFT